MNQKIISVLGWIVIPIGIVFACITSYWLTNFFFSSTFTFWKSLGSPTTGTATIVDADTNDIWVQANNGQLFATTLRCPNNELCKKWIEVASVSEINIDQNTSLKRNNSCQELELDAEGLPRNPPDEILISCVLAIDPGIEYISRTYYAVMADGSVKYWRHESNISRSFFFFIISNIVLSTVIILLFLKFRNKAVISENAG